MQTFEVSMETKVHEYLTKDNCSELKVAGGSLIEQLESL